MFYEKVSFWKRRRHLTTEKLSRFEKTNEMLINFNILSANRFGITSQVFKRHTTLMYEMKKDLDVIFKRIRLLKQRLSKLYPEAFKASCDVYTILDTDEELSSPSSVLDSVTSVHSAKTLEEPTANNSEQDIEQSQSLITASGQHASEVS